MTTIGNVLYNGHRNAVERSSRSLEFHRSTFRIDFRTGWSFFNNAWCWVERDSIAQGRHLLHRCTPPLTQTEALVLPFYSPPHTCFGVKKPDPGLITMQCRIHTPLHQIHASDRTVRENLIEAEVDVKKPKRARFKIQQMLSSRTRGITSR